MIPQALAGGLLLSVAHVAYAADAAAMAGDYVCRSDCHPSDAPPNIDIEGTAANCRSDLGGVFYGRVLSATSVACFNMVGTLSDDRKTIRWSNGGIWERH